MTTELSRPVSLAKIGAAGFSVVVRATPEECAAIAKRMDVPSIQDLTCVFNLTRDEDDDDVIYGMGHLRANVTRVCVVSAEEFETLVEDSFDVRFVPAGEEQDDIDPESDDEIAYEGDSIDLGEVAAEQLGLVLDPYPRIDGATMPDIGDDTDDSPFSVLSRRNGPEKPRE